MRLQPGQTLEKKIIDSPAGEFKVQLSCTVIDQCKVKGSIQSVKIKKISKHYQFSSKCTWNLLIIIHSINIFA